MKSIISLKSASKSSRSFSTALRATTNTSPLLYIPKPHEENSTPIIPKFWTGQNSMDESRFVVDCKKAFPHLKSLSDICIPGDLCDVKRDGKTRSLQVDVNRSEGEALHALMHDRYTDVGVVKLTNTGVTNAAELKALVQCLTKKSVLYEGGANPRDAVPESSIYETGAPLTAHIHYHHEMAYVEETVENLGFVCLENTNINKGHTFLADNNKATDILANTPLGDKLRRKGLCYVRKLPDRKYFEENPDKTDPSMVYNYWQRSFLTEDPEEAAHIARTQKNLEVEWVDSPLFGRYMITKHYTDAYEYSPHNNRNVLFSSIADDYMWFDSWDGVMNLPHEERPLKLNFGDDEVMTRAEKQIFADAYDQSGTRVPWSKGDVVVCCNVRTAHGRPPIHLADNEIRHLGVVLGPLMKKKGIIEGKWH